MVDKVADPYGTSCFSVAQGLCKETGLHNSLLQEVQKEVCLWGRGEFVEGLIVLSLLRGKPYRLKLTPA